MPRLPWRVLAAAALLFLAVLVVRLPASWARPLLPAQLSCRELSGSVWAGQCSGLAFAGARVGDVEWELRASALLRGRLAGALNLTDSRVHGSAQFEAAPSGTVVLRQLKAQLSLDPSLYRQLPQHLAGELSVDLASLELAGRRIRSIRGRLEARELEQQSSPPLQLGAYEVRFDGPPKPNGEITGVVRDLGGPVAFDGTLTLTQEPGYVLDGRVAGRPGANANILQQLEFLGSADAQGRRPLSIAGTF